MDQERCPICNAPNRSCGGHPIVQPLDLIRRPYLGTGKTMPRVRVQFKPGYILNLDQDAAERAIQANPGAMIVTGPGADPQPATAARKPGRPPKSATGATGPTGATGGTGE